VINPGFSLPAPVAQLSQESLMGKSSRNGIVMGAAVTVRGRPLRDCPKNAGEAVLRRTIPGENHWPPLTAFLMLSTTAAKSASNGFSGQASSSGLICYGDHVEGKGSRLFTLAEELSLEGVLAKRADLPYRRGRSGYWIKIKTGSGRASDEERAKWNER
jgi:hypothetical protein